MAVCVDDFHWLDVDSAQALVFAARRLGDEGVAVRLATRTKRGLEGVPELVPSGLGVDAARELLGSFDSPTLDRSSGQHVRMLAGPCRSPDVGAGHDLRDFPDANGCAVQMEFGASSFADRKGDARRSTHLMHTRDAARACT